MTRARREEEAALVRERRLLLVLALLTLAGVAALQLANATEELHYLAPTVILFGLLASGRYPGEQIVARRRAGSVATPRARPSRPDRPRPAQTVNPRGGVLLALSLGGRAPPG